TTADILKYLTVKFEEMFRRNEKFKNLCEQRDAVSRLANSSHGLFIWAYVVSRFLGDFSSEERLQSALDMILPQDAPGVIVLNNLYATVLNGVAAEHGDEDVKSHIRTILGLVIAVGRLEGIQGGPGLTDIILRGLLKHLTNKADDILSLLPRLGAVIEGVHTPHARLSLLHKSFEDYLADNSRSGYAWCIDMEGHWMPKVAEYCIHMVHSNVFSDTPEISDISSFASQYWTIAFLAHLNSSCPFPTESEPSQLLLDTLQQGLLRWVCYARNHKGAGCDNNVFSLTYGGLNKVRTFPEISL
ncbi:hypothetical protein V5O48_015755, partial [Marasmius crinis-equi]